MSLSIFLQDNFFAAGNTSREEHPFVSHGASLLNHVLGAPIIYPGPPIEPPQLPALAAAALVPNNSWIPINLPPEWIINDQYFLYAPRDMTRLIIGTFPPLAVTAGYDENLPFFYGSNDNLFWKVINSLSILPGLGVPPAAPNFFDNFGIGVTDCLRVVNRIAFGGRDEDLLQIQSNNIPAILNAYPEITDVYFTSKGVDGAMGRVQVQIGGFAVNPTYNLPGIINFNGRLIQVHLLYTPSRFGNMKIYNHGRIAFYNTLAGILNVPQGANNKVTAGNISIALGGIATQLIYRRYQYAHHFGGVPGLVNPAVTAHLAAGLAETL